MSDNHRPIGELYFITFDGVLPPLNPPGFDLINYTTGSNAPTLGSGMVDNNWSEFIGTAYFDSVDGSVLNEILSNRKYKSAHYISHRPNMSYQLEMTYPIVTGHRFESEHVFSINMSYVEIKIFSEGYDSGTFIRGQGG